MIRWPINRHLITTAAQAHEATNLSCTQVCVGKTQRMAPSKTLIIIAIATVFVPSFLGKEFSVGDTTGWTTNFDYQAWAKDALPIFNYTQGAHNVFRVNGTAFQQCLIPPANEALTSGHDVITLATPGNKWYICGVAKHCAFGNMKLAITVEPNLAPSPAPAPSAPVYFKYKHGL